MKIRNFQNKTQLESEIESNNPIQFISNLVQAYRVAGLTPDSNMTSKQEMFFICCVLWVNEGHKSYLSGRARNLYKRALGLNRVSDIAMHLNSLQEKGWLTFDKDSKTIVIPELFSEINLEGHEAEISIKLKLL